MAVMGVAFGGQRAACGAKDKAECASQITHSLNY
jgi:hypothetical protein